VGRIKDVFDSFLSKNKPFAFLLFFGVIGLFSSFYWGYYAYDYYFGSGLNKIATLTEETAIYTSARERIKDTLGNEYSIYKGSKVMIIDLKWRPKDENAEALAKVMMKNKAGDFVDGNIVAIPVRKLKIE
jgi:hypothetical protein